MPPTPAATPKAARVEKCPRCHDGHLFTVASTDDSVTKRCLACDFQASETKGKV